MLNLVMQVNYTVYMQSATPATVWQSHGLTLLYLGGTV
jgi:hypothetical protein